MTRNTDNAVLNKANATNNAKIKIKCLEWYVPHYTPSFNEYNKLMTQVKQKTPKNLHYLERSVFKKVNTQNFWTSELGIQKGVNVPIWIYVVFPENDRQHDQNLNNDTFITLPVICAQVFIGTDRYTDTAILLNYNDDEYSQGYGQIKEALRALTKYNILQPYICEDDFRSSNDGDTIG